MALRKVEYVEQEQQLRDGEPYARSGTGMEMELTQKTNPMMRERLQWISNCGGQTDKKIFGMERPILHHLACLLLIEVIHGLYSIAL